MFAYFESTLGWRELLTRTVRETIADDGLGLAAQLAYYFFLALFPTILALLALASFFPLHNVSDQSRQRWAALHRPKSSRCCASRW